MSSPADREHTGAAPGRPAPHTGGRRGRGHGQGLLDRCLSADPGSSHARGIHTAPYGGDPDVRRPVFLVGAGRQTVHDTELTPEPRSSNSAVTNRPSTPTTALLTRLRPPFWARSSTETGVR